MVCYLGDSSGDIRIQREFIVFDKEILNLVKINVWEEVF